MNATRTLTAILLTQLLATGAAVAKPHPADECRTPVSALTANGRPLTYESAAQLPGAYTVASTGTVYTPPVKLPDGREAVYAIEPDGCARKTSLRRGIR